jgi:hypothetical protein
MNAVQRLGGRYYAVFEGNSPNMKVVHRAPEIRNIFDRALYERIAKHFVDLDWTRSFDEDIEETGCHVVVEYDGAYRCYDAGVSDIGDGGDAGDEVVTNFDTYELEAYIEKIKAEREAADDTRYETELQLRRTA